MNKQERIAALGKEVQELCRSGEETEEKLMEMLVEIAKGTRYWPDVQEAVEAVEASKVKTETTFQPRRLPWRV